MKLKDLIKEESGLTKAFDRTVSEYKDLLMKRDKMIKDYLSKSSDQKLKTKDAYIKSIKKINDDIKKSEIRMNNAISNLRDPDEDELL